MECGFIWFLASSKDLIRRTTPGFQPPEDRAAGRTHELRLWATDDVFTALTTEARERGWSVSRVVEALLIEVTKTRARLEALERKR